MRPSARAFLTVLPASALLFAACSSSTAPETRVSQVTDAANDFIPSYDGPKGADLDVRTMEVTYVAGGTFVLDATLNGAPGTTPGGVYVLGINRGAGTARFGAIATGVSFDFVVIVRPGGTSSTRDLLTGTATDLPAAGVTISGNTIQVRVPASLVPSTGVAPSAYTVNLWPRNGLTGTNQIADFAPDNSNAPVRVTN